MPRAGLNRATVTAAAAEVADGRGLGRLTMGLVAERLGVRTPSLYKHGFQWNEDTDQSFDWLIDFLDRGLRHSDA